MSAPGSRIRSSTPTATSSSSHRSSTKRCSRTSRRWAGARYAIATRTTPASPTRRRCSPPPGADADRDGTRCRRGGAGRRRTRSTAPTAHLPALLYERLDEMGIDFTILYPSMTLAYLEVADDELIGVRCRAANRVLAESLRAIPRSHDRGRVGTDARSEARDRRARVRGARARFQDRRVRGPRAPRDR